MSKIIYFIAVVAFVFGIQSATYANAFSSEAEIDAYFDAQQEQLRAETEAKNWALQEQLEIDLKNIADKKEADIWEAYKRIYGSQFEMVRPFLPESNPNAVEHAYYISKLPKADALRAISNIRAVNDDLADKVLAIYEGKQVPTQVSAPILETTITPQQAKDSTQTTPVSKNEESNIAEPKNLENISVSVGEPNVPIRHAENKQENNTEPVQGFFQKIGNLFQRLMFWK